MFSYKYCECLDNIFCYYDLLKLNYMLSFDIHVNYCKTN